MRILLFIGNGLAAPYIVHGLGTALSQLGQEVLFQPIKEENMSVKDTLRSFRPHFALTLDHRGPDFEEFYTHGIPILSYFVDFPYYFIQSPDKNNFHYGLYSDPSFLPQLQKLNFKDTFYLPLATDTLNFKPRTPQSDGSISYVGSFFGTVEELKSKREAKFSPEINHFIDLILQRHKTKPFALLPELLKEESVPSLLDSLNISQTASLYYCLDQEIDSFYKTSVLHCLQNMRLKIFGPKTWETIFHNQYKGPLPYEETLSELYPNSSINIVLTRPQISQGVNQRVFDIPFHKGFFLCDYRSSMKDLFPNQHQEVSFSSLEELKDKVHYFMNAPKKRKEITRELRIEVLRKHTYTHRAESLIQYMNKKL